MFVVDIFYAAACTMCYRYYVLLNVCIQECAAFSSVVNHSVFRVLQHN